jgi:hypothetical protein
LNSKVRASPPIWISPELEEEWAMEQAVEARSIMVEGQEAREYRNQCMGMFELVEGKVVNGRAVWQRRNDTNTFIYFNNCDFATWYIGSKACMEEGKDAGWVNVPSRALTPDQITLESGELMLTNKSSGDTLLTVNEGVWRVWDIVAKTWHGAPNLQVRALTAEEQQAEVQRQAEEHALAMVQAEEAKLLVVEGQQEGEYQHQQMGNYELVPAKVVNGRAVWQRQDDSTSFMYFCKSSAMWFIGSEDCMEVGADAGRLHVSSCALTPDRITEVWRVWDGVVNGAAGWHDAPKLRVVSICVQG